MYAKIVISEGKTKFILALPSESIFEEPKIRISREYQSFLLKNMARTIFCHQKFAEIKKHRNFASHFSEITSYGDLV